MRELLRTRVLAGSKKSWCLMKDMRRAKRSRSFYIRGMAYVRVCADFLFKSLLLNGEVLIEKRADL